MRNWHSSTEKLEKPDSLYRDRLESGENVARLDAADIGSRSHTMSGEFLSVGEMVTNAAVVVRNESEPSRCNKTCCGSMTYKSNVA